MKRYKTNVVFLVLTFALVNYVKGDQFCNFEKDACEFATTWPSDWERRKATKDLPDHTNSSQGHYMIIEDIEFTELLISPKYPMSGPRCLNFYYWMSGKGQGYLSVNVKDKTSYKPKDTVIWTKQGDQGKQWRVAQMTIDSIKLPGEYEIEFKVWRKDNKDFKIAIDDIRLLDFPCGKFTVEGSHFCNFEKDACKFATSWPSDWVITKATKDLPDHTTNSSQGYYAIFEDVDIEYIDTEEVLLSPIFSMPGPRCLIFYYWMSGKGQGYLSVNARDRTSHKPIDNIIWTKQGDQGKQWRVAEMTIDPIKLPGEFEIQFLALQKDNKDFKIAIDDISLLDFPCESSTATRCSFPIWTLCIFFIVRFL